MKTWKITNLSVYPKSEGEADVVCSAAWNVSGTDGTYTGSLNGSIGFRLDPDVEFIPFDQLSEEQVLEWVFAALGEQGKVTAEADVDSQIEYAKSKIKDTPLPWNNV